MFVQLTRPGGCRVLTAVTRSRLDHPFSLSGLSVGGHCSVEANGTAGPGATGGPCLVPLLQPRAYTRRETGWTVPRKDPGGGREAAVLMSGRRGSHHVTPTKLSRSTTRPEEGRVAGDGPRAEEATVGDGGSGRPSLLTGREKEGSGRGQPLRLSIPVTAGTIPSRGDARPLTEGAR